MKNNAYIIEPKGKRLQRFQRGNGEIIETLIGSIANYFNNEIRATFDNPKNLQTSLMILGTHSVALTIAFGLFGDDKEKGYKLFLKNFVDGNTYDTKFSTIAHDIHVWRNVIAHRWLNVSGYKFNYDFTMQKGWEKRNKAVFFNPKIYLNHYLAAFDGNGKIYNYRKILNSNQKVNEAENRFLSKYIEER